MKKYLISFLIIIASCNLSAQSVSSVKAQQSDKKVIITYTLSGKSNQNFDIKVFVSKDNGKTYIGPLKLVTGDVGKDIIPGYKRIVWDALKEHDVIDSDIKFRVEADYKVKKTYDTPNSFVGYDFLSSAPLGITFGKIGAPWGHYFSIKSGFRFGYDYVTWVQDTLAGYIPLVDAGTYSYTGNKNTSVAAIAFGPTYQIKGLVFLHAGIGLAYRNSTREIKILYTEYAKVRTIEYSGFKFMFETGAKIKLSNYYLGINIAHIRPGLTQFGFSVGLLMW